MPLVNLEVSKQPNQKSMGYADAYLSRMVPTWNYSTHSADAWRTVVALQPVATLCRETIINRLLALDWKIVPEDSTQYDELRGTINHYTRLFERAGYGGDLDYTSHLEWVMSDVLDTPFGGCSEIGRKNDDPSGRVVWIKPLDAQNLMPTMNYEYPVVENYLGNVVALPRSFVARVFMSPVKKVEYQGWGKAPPEKIYQAIQMISRGDGYYANLLMDVPSVGILDLGDMERSSALEWVEAYQTMLASGADKPFKIPVLYEHNTDVKFIPFGKVPNDIMYDNITSRYMALVCGGYGITLADIGLGAGGNGGDTLAGAIRSERISNKNGFALAKKKFTYYANQILPPSLRWSFIDYDDEHLLNIGRARLATATAMSQLEEKGFITQDEGRQQMMADGLFTISMVESAPGKVETDEPSRVPERPGMVGSPVQPSAGGYGEIRSATKRGVTSVVKNTLRVVMPHVQKLKAAHTEDDLFMAKSELRELTDTTLSGALRKISPASIPASTTNLIQRYAVERMSEIAFDGLEGLTDASYDTVIDDIVGDVISLYSTFERLSTKEKQDAGN